MRALLMLGFWAVMTPLAALVAVPWTLASGSAGFMYRIAMWIVRAGLRLAGVRIETAGRETLDPSRTYLFMSNHVSNLDPPLLIPLIPRRTSVLVKKELFRIPVLGRCMRLASLVEVDRTDRDAAVASVRSAAEVMRRQGLNMTVFPEGTRSRDGRLLPFKKGPFHLAQEVGAPVVPVTILGSELLWPKGQGLPRPGTTKVIFHEPVDPSRFSDRDALIAEVRCRVASALPPERRGYPSANVSG